MIGRIEVYVRRLRRGFSRSQWLATLLGLPGSQDPAATGLIMIQIDGLGHRHIEHALAQGAMPFLKRLLTTEHYHLHHQYSGVPSATAAFQGELFYGVKGAVPGFSFRDSATKRVVRMIERGTAASVERALEEQGNDALLKDGSSYANNYTGGAAEAHFCPSAIGWGPTLSRSNPLVVVLLLLSNAYSFVRTAALLVVELVLASIDFVRGQNHGYDLVKELKFVPTRVAVSILLRELVTIGAKIDLARGIPVIHLNFLGYDEQAHRRGPSSLFAHWTLKGIDDAIARLWRAAHRATGRHYDLWVYSDHGQQEVRPYTTVQGRTLEEAVFQVFDDAGTDLDVLPVARSNGIQTHRVRQLGGKKFQRLFAVQGGDVTNVKVSDASVSVAGLGPMAFVYCDPKVTLETSEVIARGLVNSAKIPLVFTSQDTRTAIAWTSKGVFTLPEQRAEVFGSDHPFLDEVTQDLIALSQHRDAGDFILCGWCAESDACSFAVENGAHGGIGPEETDAFALLPKDAPLPFSRRSYLRASDLREAALRLLGSSEHRQTVAKRPITGETIRIMTYNVHGCIGMDGKLSPERIARNIARYAPDVVALQELDMGRARSDGIDQAHLIARHLEMEFHFHPAVHVEEEQYGDAILTHLPMRLVKADLLPGLPNRPQIEPRGALWVAIDVNGCEVQVLNTHLGLLPKERRAQALALQGPAWLDHPDCVGPVVLCGDFNALPASPVCRILNTRLSDAQVELGGHRPRRTFAGRFPTARIDHVFVSSELQVADCEVPDSEMSQVASDHLPLIVEVRIETPVAG